MRDEVKVLIMGNKECFHKYPDLKLEENFDCFECFNIEDLSTYRSLDCLFVSIYFDNDLNNSQTELIKISDSFKGNIPLLIIAENYDEYDKVLAYRIGALDVIDIDDSSPFVLIEKVRSLLCNVLKLKSFGQYPLLRDVNVGLWSMKADDLSLTVENEIIKFTRTEFKILSFLLTNHSELVEKKQIKELFSQNISDRCISVHIHKIRKKLGDWGDSLITKVGKGVILKALK